MEKYESIIISDDDLFGKTFQTLNIFRENGELCDIILKTDDGMTISAHRVVLSACSPYFRAMFTLNFIESHSHVIDLKSFHGVSLRDIIDYFYNGKLHVNQSTRNSLGLQAFARHYSLSNLKDHAMRYSCWYFHYIKDEEEFVLLPQNDLKQLISHDMLKAPSEEYIFEAIVKWLIYDYENRKEFFEELLCHIRFPLMGKDYLNGSQTVKHLIERFPKSKSLISEAISYHHAQAPGLDNVIPVKRFSPRSASEDIFIIGGWSNGQKLSTVQCFNVDTLKWSALNNMNVAHVAKEHFFRVIVSNEELYTVSFNKVMKYDPIDSAWHNVADGPEVQCKWAGVCEYDNSFYVIGGNSFKSSKKFNIEKGVWEDIPPTFVARYEFFSVFVFVNRSCMIP